MSANRGHLSLFNFLMRCIRDYPAREKLYPQVKLNSRRVSDDSRKLRGEVSHGERRFVRAKINLCAREFICARV